MFQQVEKFVTADGRADVREMVYKAMEYGNPAGDHRGWYETYEDVVNLIGKRFAGGRQWVEYCWHFNVGAYGSYVFRADGTIDGIYSFL